MSLPEKPVSKTKVILAFGVVYIVWGTTYLAIRIGIETLPPFFMAALRFLLAGALFFAWNWFRFEIKPGWRDWAKAAIPGLLMFVVANGGLTWAEQFIPTGLASLLIATIPIWMVVLHWLFFKGQRPTALTFAGIVLGLVGVTLLSGMDESVLASTALKSGSPALGIGVILFASAAWAVGSLFVRETKARVSAPFMTSMQIFSGGAILLVISLVAGEFRDVSPAIFTWPAILSILYLVFFGSILTFSAYSWLLKVSTPAKVGSYAYFNPLVAVFLGWMFAGEAVTWHTFMGAAAILLSIFLINRSKKSAKTE